MDGLTFLWLGSVALLVSGATLVSSALLDGRGADHSVDIIGGLGSAILWGVWALSAGNVERVSNGGVVGYSYEPLTYVGVMFAAGMLIVGVFGVVGIVDITDMKTSMNDELSTRR